MANENEGEPAGKAPATRFMDALFSGDMVALENSVTDDFSWFWSSTLPMGGTTRGFKNVLAQVFANAGSLYEPGTQTTTIRRAYFGDDHAVYETQLQGRTVKGREYMNRFLFLLEIKDGKVSGVREFNDTQRVAEYLFENRALHDPKTNTYDE